MDIDQKKEIALFRFSVISDLTGKVHLQRGEIESIITEKYQKKWNIPHSDKTSISRSTIRRWAKTYKENRGKLESLYPKKRNDKGDSRSLDSETKASIIQLKKEKPSLPINLLIEKMYERKLVSPKTELYAPTVYRFLKQAGLLRENLIKVDRRRFEAELPNDIWQADVMHGPYVDDFSRKRKTYLIAFIDDHSRFIPYAEFFYQENIKTFLKALKPALLSRGLPRKLYVDNGPAFRSKHLEYLTASLGISLIHSRPYVPEGRGKIERYFRTVRSQFLAEFATDSLSVLNAAFSKWLNERYHQNKHSSTGEAPFKRFAKHIELLRTAPNDLEDHFRKCVRRRVTKDRAVYLDGRLYEAPVNLIGEQVELLFHEDEPDKVEIKFKGKTYGLIKLLDTKVNVRVLRDNNKADILISESISKKKSGEMPF